MAWGIPLSTQANRYQAGGCAEVIRHLEIIVEEPSVEAALLLLMPKLIGDATFAVYVHQGKHDLLANLPNRLRGYKGRLPEDWRIIVLVDRDQDACPALKQRLEMVAVAAQLNTRAAGGNTIHVVNRIAVEELEAWFFGDWNAVKIAYPKVSANIPEKQKYRDPDAIQGGTWEALETVLKRHGYFQTGLRKIEAARSIAQHMDPERNRSKSFQVFRDAVLEAVRGGEPQSATGS